MKAAESTASTLLEIVRRARSGAGGHCTFITGDFAYRWQTEAGPDALLRIWPASEASGRAFAWLSGDHLHLIAVPGAESLVPEMLDWGERAAWELPVVSALRVPAVKAAVGITRLIRSRGYRPVEPTLVRRVRQLAHLPDRAAPLPGYTVSNVTRLDHLDGWTRAYRQAFAPEAMSAVLRRSVRQSPLYREDLDLIARDAAGEMVAFALVWLDQKTAAGTFEPLGCVPGHQRRGLATRLMVEGMWKLRELGATRAFVTTTDRRTPANRLYESLGFQSEATIQTWQTPR